MRCKDAKDLQKGSCCFRTMRLDVYRLRDDAERLIVTLKHIRILEKREQTANMKI